MHLQEHGLNEVYTGGISSYAIIYLAMAYLMSQGSPAAPEPDLEAQPLHSAFGGAESGLPSDPSPNFQGLA